MNVSGNGNGYGYMFNDNHPSKGLNYYRIVMVDMDESKKYSGVAYVNLTLSEKIDMVVSPNPADMSTTINITGNLKGNATLILYDASGNMAINVYAGQLNSHAFPTTLNVSLLKKGIYILRFIINDTALTRKIIVQ